MTLVTAGLLAFAALLGGIWWTASGGGTTAARLDADDAGEGLIPGVDSSEGSLPGVDGGQGARPGADDQGPDVAQISGTVRGPGGVGVADVAVFAFAAGSTGFAPAGADTTQADGTYGVSGLAPGGYQLRFAPPDGGLATQWYDGRPRRDTGALIEVRTGEEVTGVDVALVAAGSVTGNVGSEGSRVVAYAADDTWIGVNQAVSGPDGTYVISGIPAGPYKVAVQGDGAITWHGGATRRDAREVVVSEGATIEGVDVLPSP